MEYYGEIKTARTEQEAKVRAGRTWQKERDSYNRTGKRAERTGVL
jgi:hypothetical protein